MREFLRGVRPNVDPEKLVLPTEPQKGIQPRHCPTHIFNEPHLRSIWDAGKAYGIESTSRFYWCAVGVCIGCFIGGMFMAVVR